MHCLYSTLRSNPSFHCFHALKKEPFMSNEWFQTNLSLSKCSAEFTHHKNFLKINNSGVGIKMSLVEKFSKMINNQRGGMIISVPASTCVKGTALLGQVQKFVEGVLFVCRDTIKGVRYRDDR